MDLGRVWYLNQQSGMEFGLLLHILRHTMHSFFEHCILDWSIIGLILVWTSVFFFFNIVQKICLAIFCECKKSHKIQYVRNSIESDSIQTTENKQSAYPYTYILTQTIHLGKNTHSTYILCVLLTFCEPLSPQIGQWWQIKQYHSCPVWWIMSSLMNKQFIRLPEAWFRIIYRSVGDPIHLYHCKATSEWVTASWRLQRYAISPSVNLLYNLAPPKTICYGCRIMCYWRNVGGRERMAIILGESERLKN